MHRLIAALVVLSAATPVAAEDYPHVYLKNDKLKVKVYLPDAEKGFYRGTRFDHAGVFGEIEFAGHKIFGPWKDKHDPTNHDDIIGPAEEFGIEKPLGYDDAKPGGTFLKIGVGELEKPKEEKYSFAKKYKVVKPAGWKMAEAAKKLPNGEATVRAWETEQKANSYGYFYRKMLLVGTGQPGTTLGIRHTLKNVGDKRIVTDVYNHNFFNVDGDQVGPNYSLVFPCDMTARDLRGRFGELVELKHNQLQFKEKVPSGEFVMAGLTTLDPKGEKPRMFAMRHAASGVVVTVKHDDTFARFNVWGIKTTICPEPYLAIDLKPGEEKEWTIWYTFTHDPPKK